MSNDRKRDLERISAFVDGELDGAARAEVIRRATEDAAFARELIAQQELKAALAGSVEAPEIELAPPARRRFARAAMAVAACLVLLAAAGVGWAIHDRQTGGPDMLALDRAVETHRAWTVDPARTGATASVKPASATIDAYVPDLSANGLNLGHVSERRGADGRKTLVVGYVGSRGCRVTLLVREVAAARPAMPVYTEIGPVRSLLWRADRLVYRMLAEGMATPRFRLIATSVRRASLNHLPLDAETRFAMTRSRANTPPCAA